MRKLIICLLAILPVAGSRAQCPSILNCPQGSPVICDLSTNDSSLWNVAPYTWSQVLGTSDLYEGAVDFALKVLPCPGGGSVKISYVLLLDLNNDNLHETAVSSVDFPPAGMLFANNAFNPNYAGGDPVEFDQRVVPDSLKFRFALETSTSWDTVIARLCWQTGSLFVSPRLPEGRHHLVWRVEQDGKIKYCEHSFRMKDCQAPTLQCASTWSVSLDTSGSASLLLNDILPGAEDNTTPFPLLTFSMRKANNGSGFPTDSTGNPVQALVYDCEALDTQIVEVWVKDPNDNASHCVIPGLVTDDDGFCEEPPLLCARTFWSGGQLVEPVTFKMLWVDTAQQLITQTLPMETGGCGMLTFLPPANSFSLVAERDSFSDPLNGVSTFDLLLISRHILGTQLFDEPWKWVAADANQSGSVTTFDIVELRKLILGIYDELPSNTSWRFFPGDCVFPANPFTVYCPPEYSFITTPIWSYPPEISFFALKTGDVNGSAITSSFDSPSSEIRGAPAYLLLPDLSFKAGERHEITIQTTDPCEWTGFQFGFYFDPNVVEIEKVTPGALSGFDDNSFAQPAPGVLNCSWFGPEASVFVPGDDLLTLRVRTLVSGKLSDVVSLRSNSVFLSNAGSVQPLSSEAYTADENVRPLQLQFGETIESFRARNIIFAPQPNPTTSEVRIPVRLALPETAQVEIADFSGKVIFRNETMLGDGVQMLEIPASVLTETGVYIWRVQAGAVSGTGKIVKTE